MTSAKEYEKWIREKLNKTHDHTSDDTFTPAPVYEAVASYVARRWNLDPSNFKRPFYPGGDYLKELESYGPDDVVVDNPPFSILSKIVRNYVTHNIKFFLFAPGMTSLHYLSECSVLMCNTNIIYANNVLVKTAFVHNLDNERCFEVDPVLGDCIPQKHDLNKLPKYVQPAGVLTIAKAETISRHRIPVRLPIKGAIRVNKAYTDDGQARSLFGGGWLLTEEQQKSLQQQTGITPPVVLHLKKEKQSDD